MKRFRNVLGMFQEHEHIFNERCALNLFQFLIHT
jgi:hypothetical protein